MSKKITDHGLSKALLNSLFQYALVLCQNQDDAYDLLHTAIERYLRRLQDDAQISDIAAYIRTLIRNKFIDGYRANKRWQDEVYEEMSTYDISPVNLEQLHINRDQLNQVWRTLAPQDRDILYHWVILGYSTDEACQLLGVARGTFLSRIHRLRKHCQLIADQQGGERS